MKVTPLDLRQQQFKTVMRGYDRGEVQAFLLEASDDYENALRENDKLRTDVARLDAMLGDQPDLQAAIRNTIGSTLADLFLFDRAQPLVEQALAHFEKGGTPSHEYADALYNLAGIEAEAGSPVRAESLYTASFAMYYQLDGDSTGIWPGLNNLAGAVSALHRLGPGGVGGQPPPPQQFGQLGTHGVLRVIGHALDSRPGGIPRRCGPAPPGTGWPPGGSPACRC